ncbi:MULTISPECIES: dienelactone hydrolase family protein [unclassified Sphingomonas]|uniref:dienelactone hydrolase family protein n=1 Tax=unclassified Sphingomonas TaxID=196159 RepID=UPI0009EA554D|nr:MULTISPECIES: dienelactone hydrolase family protein [unclassified Sphingomonas]
MHEQLVIPAADGPCPAHLFLPDGEGQWPAVIVYMDALAIRPTMIDLAARIAAAGYVVLLPDLFYRHGPYAPIVASEIKDFRAEIGPLMATIDNRKAAADTAQFLAFLDTRPDVKGRKVGVTGYCMGGGMALTAAATFPDRIVAAASFHGGSLATDAADSPHLLAPQIAAEIYVAGADRDRAYPPEMAERLETALTEAGVTHRCEIYAGAIHGWTMNDLPIYNQPAAERAFAELIALFARTLGQVGNA